MKKLLFITFILSFSLLSFGQRKPAEVAPNGYITMPDYQYVWGTAADTQTNADTLDFVWRVKGKNVFDMTIKLYNDHVSGTAGGKLKTYYSIDGVNYTLKDSIVVSSLTADALDSEVITIDNFLYPYLKVNYIQSGTAVTIPKVYFYVKEN